MQVKKEELRQRLLDAAGGEFREKGFNGASLREIAQRAKVTKGALYPYFANKGALFQALTAPARETVSAMFARAEDQSLWAARDTMGMAERRETVLESFRQFAREVLAQRDSFRLLLLCNRWEDYRQYKESVILAYEKRFDQIFPWFVPAQRRNVRVSQVFIHTMASLFFSYIEELILHNVSPEEGDAYAEEMALFALSGAEKLSDRGEI